MADSTKTDAPPMPADLLAAIQGKHVCPFCGAVRDDAGAACARCTMEDTPATRQATKNRIGPWYVLQSRNPAAPGMRYATLLALVKKGQITARAIVRGPTTHQLWAFAARVKGLSREFGICYSCAADIDPGANVCPQCHKLQEPPLNPDSLLETRSTLAERLPIRREIRPESDSSAPDVSGDPRPQTPPFSLPVMRTAPLAATESESILSAKDLAEAFGLDVPADIRPRASRRVAKVLAAALLITAVGIAALLYLDPELRQQFTEWANKTWKAPGGARPRGGIPMPATVPAAPLVVEHPTIPLTPSHPPDPPVAISPVPATTQPTSSIIAITPAPRLDPVAPPKPPEPADPVELARNLWKIAIEAEANHNFLAAVDYYEQIKKLPSLAWPAGLDARLDAARQRAHER